MIKARLTFAHVYLPAALWHHPSPIQSLRKLKLLRQKPCVALEREGQLEHGRIKRKHRIGKRDISKEAGRQREREREIWEGNKESKKRGRDREKDRMQRQREGEREAGRVRVFC